MRSIFKTLFLVMICCGMLAHTAHAADITPDGTRLADRLDQTRVTELWLAGARISWETGEPNGKPLTTKGRHTHCSAFVAATAKNLGIYILRPPEHGQTLLANAQYDWLVDKGSSRRWNEVQGDEQAQEFANRGYLVVAAYRNHRDDKPGHIAIVRPSSKSAQEIEMEGPQIIQAGGTNYSSSTLKQGFAGHPSAWGRKEVRYFAHEVDWANIQ